MSRVYRNGNYSAYYGYVDPEDDPEEEELKEHEWWLEAEKELAATEEGCREELDGNATSHQQERGDPVPGPKPD